MAGLTIAASVQRRSWWPRTAWVRRVPVRLWRGGGLLLGVALLLTGCVYLRLLELKRQLADFDNCFVVDAREGLALKFRKPVLRDDDVLSLGIVPTERTKDGAAERWHFRWIKDSAPGDAPGVTYEQTADFVFVNRKLAGVRIPERFFAFFPKSRVIASLRSMGRAKVDRTRRVASGALATNGSDDAMPPLRNVDLEAMLGAPVAIGGADEAPEWRYSFRAARTGRRTGPIDVVFTLQRRTGTVVRVRGMLVAGTIEFDYSGAPAARRE